MVRLWECPHRRRLIRFGFITPSEIFSEGVTDMINKLTIAAGKGEVIEKHKSEIVLRTFFA